MKDHPDMIRAMATLIARSVDAQLLLVGRGVDDPAGSIARAVDQAGLGGRVMLLGEHEDIRPIVAGLDILASSSAWGEALPLIVGDTMASGVPCVVTDIGDCAWIVGDTGAVVPPRDSEALAAALARLVALSPEERRRLGAATRARIRDKYSLGDVARRYVERYQRLAEKQGAQNGRGRPGGAARRPRSASDMAHRIAD